MDKSQAASKDASSGPLKYTKFGIAFGLVLVLTGVLVTILYGYRPAPTRIMKPSFFETADQVGVVALKRFYAPLANEKVVIFGVPSNRDWSTGVVRGFITGAAQNSRAFSQVIVEQKLSQELRDEVRKLVPKMTELETNTEMLADIIDIIQSAEKAGERVLLVVPNLYSTHLLPGNMMSRLENALIPMEERDKGRIVSLFSISVGPLALEAAQEKEVDPICQGSERDGSGTADFGCAMLQAGRYYYRKRILDTEPNARERFTALMQSPKPNDYLLLVREPVRK